MVWTHRQDRRVANTNTSLSEHHTRPMRIRLNPLNARANIHCHAGLPRRLSEVGLDRERIGWLAENSGGASLRGNPLELDRGSLLGILERIW